jgi:VanZ family protein
MKRIRYFFPAFVWGVFILAIMLIPGDFIPYIRTFSQWLQWDKITHLILFGVFSVIFLIGFYKYRLSVISGKNYLTTVIISVLYGGFTEYLQYILNIGRDGNVYDFCANTIGIGLGCLLFFFISKRETQKG